MATAEDRAAFTSAMAAIYADELKLVHGMNDARL